MNKDEREQLRTDPKAFLRQANQTKARMAEREEEIRRLRALAEKSTTVLSAEPKGGRNGSSRVESYAVKIADIEAEITGELAELQRTRRLVVEAAALLPDPTQRAVIELRYLSHMRWEKIAGALGYSYQWTMRLHGQALNFFRSL